MSKYKDFVDKIINESPKFMIIEEENEKYLLFDRFVTSLSENAMPWLFKVYLDKNYNILKDDKFTNEIKDKYKDIDMKLIDVNGNIFLNKNSLEVILNELDLNNQIEYNKENLDLKLL
ncbi:MULTISPECIES: hypothetical protein [unclassified Romboutsia]|uniref:hypothetical protein n=1 Tax=unclassified Romboutsia TaxID=2626894 RepID=UPI0008229790|nr:MULTISPECIES: hypothetical protein [unclassified Romboutsia]SCI13847.1 Uncharacterised protein [uncultured Clostridium sp.]